MVKSFSISGGKYFELGGIRLYVMTGAVTANSTIVTGARQGDIIKTVHATGRGSMFIADGASKAQFLVNA